MQTVDVVSMTAAGPWQRVNVVAMRRQKDKQGEKAKGEALLKDSCPLELHPAQQSPFSFFSV